MHEQDRAATMGRADRERVLQHFTWDEVARRTARLYRELLGGTGGTDRPRA
ncbi:hypothetical protein LWF15_28980 [Kineosporia rhizophila]|uniref:glycosyltransferase n=1 Tax=Kineosporia TaxID=49184 RepID=UPI000AF91BB5|nr:MULTISPECIES: hypothetical protein [Kineosporia]MCE0539541.1 hypothetical protein [Kineosporia rhizophila]